MIWNSTILYTIAFNFKQYDPECAIHMIEICSIVNTLWRKIFSENRQKEIKQELINLFAYNLSTNYSFNMKNIYKKMALSITYKSDTLFKILDSGLKLFSYNTIINNPSESHDLLRVIVKKYINVDNNTMYTSLKRACGEIIRSNKNILMCQIRIYLNKKYNFQYIYVTKINHELKHMIRNRKNQIKNHIRYTSDPLSVYPNCSISIYFNNDPVY